MNLTCCIIDDEPLAIELLEEYVNKTEGLTLIGKYNSATAALSEILSKKPDFLLLDIQLPDLSGLEFSKIVKDKTKVIFTTAFEKYAVESYRLNAVDYLLKPISYPDFLSAVEKVNSAKEMTETLANTDSIFIRSEYKLHQIKYNDIIFIEGLKDYLKIYVESSDQPILCLNTIKAMENSLPKNRFIRVHRSFIINIDKVTTIDRNRIVFGKHYIPISDTFKDTLSDFIVKRTPQKEQ